MRHYTIVLDGAEVGKIGNGETQSLSLPPGAHTLQLKIDWVGSSENRFIATAGETISFSCRPTTKPALWAMIESVRHKDRHVILTRR